MRYLKKGMKIFFKVLLVLIIAPMAIHAWFLFIQSFMREISIHLCAEPIQWYANDFMAKHGNRYFAFDLVYYLKEQRDPYFCEESFHEKAFAKLLKKYPDMRELYLGALVEAILDRRTTNYNRINLISVLEQNTGIDFTEQGDKLVEYEELKPYTQKGIRNVADWWSKHLEEKATAAIAATEKDYLFPSSQRYLEIMGIKPEKRRKEK